MSELLIKGALFCMIIIICYSLALSLECDHQNSDDYEENCSPPFERPDGCQIGQDSCREWCKEQDFIKWKVLNSTSGLVRFHFPISPRNCCHDLFKVSLYREETLFCNQKTFSTHANVKHSEKEYSLKMFTNESFPEELLFEVGFISTGCYILEILPKIQCNSHQACKSQPFIMTTNYEKKILAGKDVSIGSTYIGESSELTIAASGVGFGVGWAQMIILEISTMSCSSYKNVKLYYALIAPNSLEQDCCSNSIYNESKCYCKWHYHVLKCTFEEVAPGNYCVTLVLDDTRCASGTFWTSNSQHCRWFQNLVLNATKTSSYIEAQVSPSYVYLVIPAVPLLLVLLFLLKFKLGSFRKNKPSEPFNSTRVEVRVESKTPKILLSYPRDCPIFMDTMAEFRKLLKQELNSEVYDTWDSGIWETIAENGSTWALRHVYDQDVRIILVATRCSRFIHDALLNGREVEYTDAETFDNVFPVTLKSIMDISVTQPYQRTYVIRLDEEDFEDNVFKIISPFTIYTIPQQLNILINSLKNMDSCEALSLDKQYYIHSLSTLVDKLNKYKVDNPYYFKHMIHTKES